MTAVAKLPEKWRATAEAIAKPYGFVTEHTLGKAEALNNCADELTAALSPAELDGVEPVAWTSQTSMDMLAESGTGIMSRIHTDYASIPLYTTPRAAEAVDDAMVERYIEAYHYALADTDSEITAVRAGLAAALTQGE